VQHDPGALHILKRELLGPRGPLEHDTLSVGEFDAVTGRARHHDTSSTTTAELLHIIPADTSGRLY